MKNIIFCNVIIIMNTQTTNLHNYSMNKHHHYTSTIEMQEINIRTDSS